ncbi:MAG: DUF2804 domain-containing protein [Desulfovibrionales bacterium]|nr:DUF2804 domain-containing protein [Desulfovibrionales bacterium]
MIPRPEFGPLAPQSLPSDIRNLLRPPQGRLWPWQFKRWCYVGVVHPDLIFGAAMAHLGYVTHAFAQVFDRRNQEIIEDARLFPPLGKIKFNGHPNQGKIQFSSPGGHWELQAEQGGYELKIAFPKKCFFGKFHLSLDDFEPRHFYLPMDKGNKAFTTKAPGLKARGSLQFKGQTHCLDRGARGILDWTQGVYPRRTQWNWACGTGLSNQGVPLSFNFSRGVYEYGQLENTIWIQGIPFPTGPVEFDYKALDAPWQINSLDGRANLIFTPEGLRQKDENLGLIHSKFTQPQGGFQGRLTTPDGDTHILERVSGVTEEHFAKW